MIFDLVLEVGPPFFAAGFFGAVGWRLGSVAWVVLTHWRPFMMKVGRLRFVHWKNRLITDRWPRYGWPWNGSPW